MVQIPFSKYSLPKGLAGIGCLPVPTFYRPSTLVSNYLATGSSAFKFLRHFSVFFNLTREYLPIGKD
jgi:hypothetical protein